MPRLGRVCAPPQQPPKEGRWNKSQERPGTNEMEIANHAAASGLRSTVMGEEPVLTRRNE
jgi:hypothetical protein